MNIKNLTLKQKIAQMFITGFIGTDYLKNKYFANLIQNYLGGVIFFSHNIESEKQIKELVQKLNNNSSLPMFLSIDQEGGKVERTEKIHRGKKYLSAKPAFEMGLSYLQDQTKQIALELKNYGMNMNFAPVLDVNTNKDNPIIGERAFSSNTQDVIIASKIVIKEYEKYGIIPAAKHFPGHGAASLDSHKTLPVINLSKEELITKHILPFAQAIKTGLPAIMAAHVIYPAFDDKMPASLSKKIITGILIKDLAFNGIIITDDMEMNAVKGFSKEDACYSAINAGITMFIFRDTTEEVFSLIEKIEQKVKTGDIPEEKINNAFEKIIDLKYRYGIIR